MSEEAQTKVYDLEDRTLRFAKMVREFVKNIPRTIANIEDGKQVIRSSGSVGANYIEANESLSDKDCVHRMKICRKEAKESKYWLSLIYLGNNQSLENERQKLIKEAIEIMLIFGAMISKKQKRLNN